MKIYFIEYEFTLTELKYIFISYEFLFLQHSSNHNQIDTVKAFKVFKGWCLFIQTFLVI